MSTVMNTDNVYTITAIEEPITYDTIVNDGMDKCRTIVQSSKHL